MIFLGSNGASAVALLPQVLGKTGSDIRFLYVTTASKGARDLAYLTQHKEAMHAQGYAFTEYDIEGKTLNELRRKIAGFSVLYMEGGNTFYLLKAVQESGFAAIIREFLERGGTYVGTSAGAYICCPRIDMSTWKKPGEEHPRSGLTDLTGMNLVPFIVFAHYTPDKEPEVRAGITQCPYPVRILQDGQGLLVHDDGTVEFMGEGKEITLSR